MQPMDFHSVEQNLLPFLAGQLLSVSHRIVLFSQHASAVDLHAFQAVVLDLDLPVSEVQVAVGIDYWI